MDIKKVNLSKMIWPVCHKSADPHHDDWEWVGTYDSVNSYLEGKNLEKLNVGSVPATNWLNWFVNYVIPVIVSNDGDDKFEVEYPW